MIRSIPGTRGAQGYLVRSDHGVAVIDPGYTGSSRAVLAFLDTVDLDRTAVECVILTHHHIDHAGTAFALCQATGARLAIHRADAPYLRAERPRERITLWGLVDRLPARWAPYLVSCADCDVEQLEDGDVICGLRVIHAPGHTPGSICLWSATESALFTGDVLNNERGIRTPPWTVNHAHAVARTAPERLRGLHYDCAYFGHGPAILEQADQRVDVFLRRTPATPQALRRPQAHQPPSNRP